MLSNWTKATTTTTGTGTLTLSAVTGFPLPSASLAAGQHVQYSVKTSDGKYEAGIGKVAAANTLERTKVFSTYDGTTYNNTTATALNLAAGTHEVLITPVSDAIVEPAQFWLASGPTDPCIVSGHLGTTQVNANTGAAQRAMAYPFLLTTSGILTSMSIRCAVAGAASTTLLGLYQAASDGRPGKLLAKTSATIDTSTTGYKSQAVDSNIRLTPGWYWAAICVTAGTNPSFTAVSTYQHHAFGSCTISGNLLPLASIREDAAATDLADPFPVTATSYLSTANQPILIGLILS